MLKELNKAKVIRNLLSLKFMKKPILKLLNGNAHQFDWRIRFYFGQFEAIW